MARKYQLKPRTDVRAYRTIDPAQEAMVELGYDAWLKLGASPTYTTDGERPAIKLLGKGEAPINVRLLKSMACVSIEQLSGTIEERMPSSFRGEIPLTPVGISLRRGVITKEGPRDLLEVKFTGLELQAERDRLVTTTRASAVAEPLYAATMPFGYIYPHTPDAFLQEFEEGLSGEITAAAGFVAIGSRPEKVI